MSHAASLNSPSPSDPIVATDVSDIVTLVTGLHSGATPIHDALERLADDTRDAADAPNVWPAGFTFQAVTPAGSGDWPTGVAEVGTVYTFQSPTVNGPASQWFLHQSGGVQFRSGVSGGGSWNPWVYLYPQTRVPGGRVDRVRSSATSGLTAWTSTRAQVFNALASGGPWPAGSVLRMDAVVTAQFTNVPKNRTLEMIVGHKDNGGTNQFPGAIVQVASTGNVTGTLTRPKLQITHTLLGVQCEVRSTGNIDVVVEANTGAGEANITPTAIELTAVIRVPE